MRPPPPISADLTPIVAKVRVELLISGSVDDVTESDKASIAAAIAGAAGVDPSAVVITVVASSVRIIAEIVFASAEVRDDGQATLVRAMATPESATALLSNAQVTVLQAPAIVAVDEPAPVGSDSDGGSSGTVLAAAAGATVLVTLAGSLLLWRCRQHTGPKRARPPPKTQTDIVPATPPPPQPPLVPSSKASVAAAVSASEVQPSDLRQNDGAANGITLEQESVTLTLEEVTTVSEPAGATNDNLTHLPIAYNSAQGGLKDAPSLSLPEGVVSAAEAPKTSSIADKGPTKADDFSTSPPAAVSERNSALDQALSRGSMAESSLLSLPQDYGGDTALAQTPGPDAQPSNLFQEFSARLSTAFRTGTSAFSMGMPGAVEDAKVNDPSSIDC